MNWTESTLGQLLQLQRGFDLPSDNRSYGEIPIIGSAGITGFHNEAKVFGGGVTIGRSGNSFGKVFKCKVDFWPHNAALYVKETFGNDINFIYYFLLNLDFSNYNSGSAQPSLNRNFIYPIQIKIPPLKTQERIASILSAYDDLIENNLKRIKLLEETTQNIYKEWFVNFHFPNYENTPFNKETGLPKGWEIKSLNNFNCFYQFKEKVRPFLGEKEYLATANVEGIKISERGEYFTFENKPTRAQHLAPQESVWFARMNKTYKVLLFTKSSNCDILLSSGFVGFVPKKSQFLPFLFCLINNKLFFDTKDLFCTGSTQVSLNNESINNLLYVEPNEEIIMEFGKKVYPLIEQINKIFELNQKLKEARDILLPRLMNRMIEV